VSINQDRQSNFIAKDPKMHKLTKIGIKLNRIFTKSTGVFLIMIGAIFVLKGSTNIEEFPARVSVIVIGLIFMGLGIYYYFKSKKSNWYGKK